MEGKQSEGANMQISTGLPRELRTLEGPEVATLGEYWLRVLSSSVASQ